MHEKNFDIVLFGATGFVGKLTAAHLAQRCREKGFRLAIAGRNREKLEAVAREIAAEDGSGPEIIIADSDDADSIQNLVAETAVVCTTVGPYSRLGSGLVEACAREGTDYCDLTGEVQWMRRMIDRYDTRARETGARIVHTAGFDSIPSDLGVLLAQNHLISLRGGPAKSLRFRLHRSVGGVSRGTLESMVELVREAVRDSHVREILADPHSLEPLWEPPSKRAGTGPFRPGRPRTDGSRTGRPRTGRLPWRDTGTGQWTVPFFMEDINRRVVHRTNALLGFPWGKDFSYREVIFTGKGPGGFLACLALRTAMSLIGPAIAVPPLRFLVRATLFPRKGAGPRVALEGGGSFEAHIEVPETGASVVGMAAPRDPGYGATSVMLGETALLLRESTGPGGILTPAVALGTELAQRLNAAGVTFTPSNPF